MSPGKVYKLLKILTIWLTAQRSEPAQEKWFKSNHPYIYTGHLRYLKLGCLENPTYVELIPHSQASLPICCCISTLLVSNTVMTKTRLCRSDNSLPTEKEHWFHPSCVKLGIQKSVFDIYTQPFITEIVIERFEIMFQVGEYTCTFEITIDVVNMVERTTTQSENVKELRFSYKNIGWSQFAYLKLRKTRSGFSIPLDFEIAKVACICLFGLLGCLF